MSDEKKGAVLTGEEWRRIPGFPRYEVSTLGHLRSYARDASRPRPMRPCPGRHGYLRTTLTVGDKKGSHSVHVLVLLAFVGPRPDGLQGAHLDGNNQNNALANLMWATPLENAQHKTLHGTQVKGERAALAKLTDQAIEEIRASGAMTIDLARRYGVDGSTIRKVRRGQLWRHVAGDTKRGPHTPLGARHNSVRLTAEQVSEIKRALRGPVVKVELARAYGVSEGAIHSIARGKSWTYVEAAE